VTEAEILVIGGGIAGVCTAYFLARHGREVALLERGKIASEASGVNAGSITAIGWGNAPDLESHLTMGSLEMFKSLQLDHGYDIEFRQAGGLYAVHTAEQHDYAQARVHRLRSQGYAVELLSNREARCIEPEANGEMPGYVYRPLRSQADPVKATRAFAAAAARLGAQIMEGHEVTGLRARGPGGYEVETSQGQFRGETLVLAAGAWCGPLGRMLGLDVPIVPVRGQMWATEALPPWVHLGIGSVESAHFWSGEERQLGDGPPELTHRGGRRATRHLYGRQRRNGEVIFGGDRQAEGFDRLVDREGIEVNREHAAEVLPFLEGVAVRRTWVGLMPFTPDGRPVIGRLPFLENAFIVSGLASSGFGRGPMAGKLLADYVHSGHRAPVLEEVAPGRSVGLVGG